MLNGRALRAAVSAAMTFSAALAANAQFKAEDFKNEWIPSLAVPRMSKPPVIDGTIDPNEWRESSSLSGVADCGVPYLLPRPTTYYLAWDPGHIYLACRTYLRPGVKPAVYGGRADGLANTSDDGMEFVWKPMGKNAVNRNFAYKFFMNSIGNKGDTCRLTLGQMFKDWSPKFKAAHRLTEPGSAPGGGRWLEIEMSCTPEDFELKGENSAGDEWRMMLGFNHIPMWLQARIPCVGSYFDDSGGGYPRMTLSEGAPAVQLLQESLSNLSSDGTADLAIRACNPLKQEAKIDISVDVAGQIAKNETLTLPPGGEATFKMSEKLPPDVKTGVMHIKALCAGKPLLTYSTFFKVGNRPDMLAPVPPRDPNKFGLDVKFNPVTGLVFLTGDTWFFDKPEDAASMSWKIYPEGAPDKAVASGKEEKTVLWRFQRLEELPELKVGKYSVEATIAMKDGKTCGPMTAAIEKKDEAKEYPQWWGKDFGSSEQVIPPFTAIKSVQVSGVGVQEENPASSPDTRNLIPETFSCWGREYALTGLGLPAGIKSQDKPVLGAPARIVVKSGGKETVVPLAKAEITDRKDWRVRFKGTASGAGLAFSAEGWLEQDGFVYTRLTYGPEGKEPVAVEALRIEYPLADEDADALVCLGPGGNFSSMTAMLLPREKQGQLWSTLVTGRPGSGMVKGSFYPTVWVGNEHRGLVWWADSDRGWLPEDDVPAHEVVREKVSGVSVQVSGKSEEKAPDSRQPTADTCVVLRNNILGKPATLAEKRTVEFSYAATPFRPFVKGWRSIGATDDGTFVVPFRGLRKDSKTGEMVDPGARQQNWIHPESRYPEEWDAMWEEQRTKGLAGTNYTVGADQHAKQLQWTNPYAARSGVNWAHMSLCLFGYGPKTIEEKLLAYFGGNWTDEHDDRLIDYLMYLFDGAIGKGGVRSTYFDITFPVQNANPVRGLCYLLPDGRLQPGYVGWGSRRLYQRLQAVFAKYKLVPGAHGGHSTNAYLTVAMPWMDAVLDGERDFNLDVSDRDWVDNYSIERMRSMSSPHNWGVPICWMGNIYSSNQSKVDIVKLKRAEYLWMHDSWKNPYAGVGREDMPDKILDFGLNGDATAYSPYWRNPYASCPDKSLLVSTWRIADNDDTAMLAVPTTGPVDRALIGVYNYDRQNPRGATIKVDLKALGLDAPDSTVIARELYGPETGNDNYGNRVASDLFGMECRLDTSAGILELPPVPPHRGRYIGLQRLRKAESEKFSSELKSVADKAGAVLSIRPGEGLLNWGAADPGAAFCELGKAPDVAADNPAVQVASWTFKDRTLLAIVNTGDKPIDANLSVDLDKMNLVPRLPWQEYIRVRDFSRSERTATLDYHARKLAIPQLAPKTVQLVGIRRY